MGLADNQALLIDRGKRTQVRGGRRQDISPEQIATFLETLADTCNVVRSARAAGFSANWAYRLRRREASFRNGWAEAIREGYAKLELVLLERAMKGTPKLVRTARGTDRVMRQYSTALAVALLRRHADTAESADYEPGEDEMREVRERIIERLERMRARDVVDGGALQPVETKGIDRLGLIMWALRRQGQQALIPLAFGGSPPSGEDRPQRSSGVRGTTGLMIPPAGEGN